MLVNYSIHLPARVLSCVRFIEQDITVLLKWCYILSLFVSQFCTLCLYIFVHTHSLSLFASLAMSTSWLYTLITTQQHFVDTTLMK